jgi:hypothetical protein
MLLCVSVSACGTSHKDSSSTSENPPTTVAKPVARSTTPANIPPAPVETKPDADKDNDTHAANDDTNNRQALQFGHLASPSEKRVIVSLIRRYYKAALAEDGRAGCSMLYSLLEESIPEDFGETPAGPPYMRGATTCAAGLTDLFKHFHPQLAVELPKLKVARVGLIEHHGMALLHFGGLPEREITVVREGHVWKMSAMYDNEVP